MKKIILTILFMIQTSCISIYQSDLAIPKNPINPIIANYSIEIGNEEVVVYGGAPESFKEISPELKRTIKDKIVENLSSNCIKSSLPKTLKVSYFTITKSNNSCWLFNLCPLVWPAISSGTHAIKFTLNSAEESFSSEKVNFTQYGHILLFPTLFFKSLSNRKEKAFLKLADTFSKNLCANEHGKLL